MPLIILMTKWPAAGRCKSRLAKKIGSKNAAAIQTQLTKHTIAVAKNLEREGLVEIKLAIGGLSSKAEKRWAIREGVKQIGHQGDGSLGLRMRKQILKAQKVNIVRTTILVGSDLPSLGRVDLIKAIEALKEHEIVLGPSRDGGYWLIGLSKKLVKPVPIWPFSGISWGTNKVLKQTIQRAEKERVSYVLLREQNDIDQIEDLAPWNG